MTPGIYASDSGTFMITGTLTLDAQGDPDDVFVFKTVSTLITASGSSVNLLNSARFCRIFWKVGTSATLLIAYLFEHQIDFVMRAKRNFSNGVMNAKK